jgi:dienelactone hydrolase
MTSLISTPQELWRTPDVRRLLRIRNRREPVSDAVVPPTENTASATYALARPQQPPRVQASRRPRRRAPSSRSRDRRRARSRGSNAARSPAIFVADLASEVGYAGFSLGVLPAQMLAQTRAGAKSVLLFHSCVPLSEFGGEWPNGLPVQIHAMEVDELFVTEGDLDAARQLVDATDAAELFLYPGDQHLFAESSLPRYDDAAATLLKQRVLSFLDGIP